MLSDLPVICSVLEQLVLQDQSLYQQDKLALLLRGDLDMLLVVG